MVGKFGLYLAVAGRAHKTEEKYPVVMAFQFGNEHCQTQSNTLLFFFQFPSFPNNKNIHSIALCSREDGSGLCLHCAVWKLLEWQAVTLAFLPPLRKV